MSVTIFIFFDLCKNNFFRMSLLDNTTTFMLLGIFSLLTINNNEIKNHNFGFSRNNKDADSIIIECNIDTTLSFYYIDSLYKGHPIFIKKGINKLPVNYEFQLIKADKTQALFTIQPNEFLVFSHDFASLKLKFEKNKQRNNELIFFKQLVDNSGSLRHGFHSPYYIKKVNSVSKFHQNELEVNRIEANRLAFLDSFSQVNSISNMFYKLSSEIILESGINDKLLLYSVNKELLEKEGIYNLKLDSCIKRINNLEVSHTVSFMELCQTALALKMKKPPMESISSVAQLQDAILIINNIFFRTPKNFLLVKCVNDLLDADIEIPDSLYSKIRENCDKNWFKLIESKRKKNSKVGLNQTLMQTLYGEDVDLEKVIKNEKGNIILLDFWASWCKPCRDEMKNSKALKEIYANEPVKFIYISVDKNLNDWKSACNNDKIGDTANYILPNSQKSLFVIQNKIYSLPRYILIGKNGKIISKDAPRPGDLKLRTLIDKSLK